MTFENVELLLKWYFTRRWIKRPKPPGNHDPNYIKGWSRQQAAEQTYIAIFEIKKVVEKMSFRERSLIKQLHTGTPISVIANRRGYSVKTIQRALQRVNDDLHRQFKTAGLIWSENERRLTDFFEMEE